MKSKIIQINGCHISTIQILRSDDLIIFIHGLGCSKKNFEKLFTESSLAEYSFLATDLIGFGDSDCPRDFSYRLDEQADILREIIKKMSFQKIHIVGHSMGAVIALLLSQKLYDKAKSLINIDGRLSNTINGFLAQNILSYDLKDFIDFGFQRMLNKFRKSNNTNEQLWLKFCYKIKPYSLYQSAFQYDKLLKGEGLFDCFKSVDIKKSFIYSGNKSKKEYFKSVKNISTYYIEKSSHFIPIDQPKQLALIIDKFIQK